MVAADQCKSTIGKAIVGALRVAVRTSRNDLGLQICDFLRERRAVRQSIHRKCYDKAWQDCVSYGNTALFPTLLYWKKNDELSAPNTDLTGLKLNKKEFLHIAKNARPTLVRHMISSGILDPNCTEGRRIDRDTVKVENPLWLALSVRAYQIAKALIECGADINRRLPFPKHNMTAYSQAYARRDGDTQYNLLLWGADFRPLDQRQSGSVRHMKKPRIQHLHGHVPFEDYKKWRASRLGKYDALEAWKL